MLANVSWGGAKTPPVEKHYPECKCNLPVELLGELNKLTMSVQIPNHWIHIPMHLSNCFSCPRHCCSIRVCRSWFEPWSVMWGPLLFTCSQLGLGFFCGGLQGDRRNRKGMGPQVRSGGPSQICCLPAVKRLTMSLCRSQFPHNVVWELSGIPCVKHLVCCKLFTFQ